MRAHHTKDKGDLGVLHAQVDLARRGFAVLLPLTEHAPFDLVAYRDARFYRVQVKYRTAKKGCISVRLATFWADRHGVHTRPVDRDSIDLFCIYCPDTDRCYYVDAPTCPAQIFLRVEPAKSAQQKRIRWARDYEDLPPSVRGISAGCSRALEGPPYVRHSPSHRGRYLYAPIAQLD